MIAAEEPGGDLNRIPDDRFDQLAVRARLVSELARREARSRWDIEQAAFQAGVHPATIYRDLKRALGDEQVTVRDLAGRKGGFPAGRSRLHPQVETVIAEGLLNHHLTAQRPPLTETVTVIGEACAQLGLPPPTRPTIDRRLKKLNRAQVEGRRNGKAARERATARPGTFRVENPWDVWEIDHTLADVIIVDKVSRKPLGRPWLTVVVDVATRLIVGFYVSLEPPSILRAGTAIDLAVQPKAKWLKRLGLNYPWPAQGLPVLVHSDRAKEFRAKAFVRALANQGVETFLRPPGATHWGGHIERLIGTMMGKCKMLPGATQNSPKARGDYDSCKGARLDIDQLESWFAHEILGVYHNTVHSALKCTPLEAWTRMVGQRVARLPADLETFRIDLFPEFVGTVTRTGIKAFGEEYASSDTLVAFAGGTKKVRIKFDPRDLRQLHVELEPGRYTTVPYRLSDHTGRHPTLWFYKYARSRAVQQGRPVDGLLARQAQAAAEAELYGEAASSKVARKALERLRHARAATSGPVIEDDSWGGAL